MLAVKGRYNGATVVLESIPNSVELGTPIKECEVIVSFPDISASPDDGSLAYLFRDYIDDGIREPIVNTKGTVLLDQLVTLDYKARSFQFIEKVPSDFLLQLLGVTQRIFTV